MYVHYCNAICRYKPRAGIYFGHKIIYSYYIHKQYGLCLHSTATSTPCRIAHFYRSTDHSRGALEKRKKKRSCTPCSLKITHTTPSLTKFFVELQRVLNFRACCWFRAQNLCSSFRRREVFNANIILHQSLLFLTGLYIKYILRHPCYLSFVGRAPTAFPFVRSRLVGVIWIKSNII